MSIQSVNSTASLSQTMQTDCQALKQALAASQSAQNAGNQDQVTILQGALQKAASALLSDISSMQSTSTNPSVNSTTTSSSASSTNLTPLQILTQDLTNLQSAIQSGDQSKVQGAENTLGTDITGLNKGHHHHHHHGGQGLTEALSATATNGTASVSIGGTSTSNNTAQ